MACTVADHKNLHDLRSDLDLEHVCHSPRRDCINNAKSIKGPDTTYGIQGGVIGYCQGLWNREHRTPAEHTRFLCETLKGLGAPFSSSHELFAHQKPQGMPMENYIREASRPLLGDGRVPILITDYDAKDKEINDIFKAKSPVNRTESILVRMTLNNHDSIAAAAGLISGAVQEAYVQQRMPGWWPLLQGGASFSRNDWRQLEEAIAENWKYVTLAVNPFSWDALELYKPNVSVAQWLVGRPGEIFENGDVYMHTQACTLGRAGYTSYNINEYAAALKESGINPTNIVCGGSQPSWSEDENTMRMQAYLPLFKESVQQLWPISKRRKESLLELSA